MRCVEFDSPGSRDDASRLRIVQNRVGDEFVDELAQSGRCLGWSTLAAAANQALAAIDAARAARMHRTTARTATGGIDTDAKLVSAHSDKEHAAATFKRERVSPAGLLHRPWPERHR